MTEPESQTLAYLRRLDEKLDRFHSEAGERFDRIESRLGQIADELLVLKRRRAAPGRPRDRDHGAEGDA
jgi:hypothetical protein